MLSVAAVGGCVEPGGEVSDSTSETSVDTSSTEEPADTSSSTGETETDTSTSTGETETDTSSSTGETETDTDSSTDETDTGETDTGETDTGETDTGETDTGEEPEGLCGWEPGRGIMALLDEDTLTVSLLRSDGVTSELDTSLPAAADDAALNLIMDARGESLFVGVYDDLGGAEHTRAHYRVYDRDTGAVVWELADDEWEPEGRAPYVASDGRAAFFAYSPYNESDNSYSRVLGPDGLVDHFNGVAAGPVMPDDWMAIEVGESSPRFRNVVTKQQVGLAHSIWDDYNSIWLQSESLLIYLSSINGELHVVEQHANEVTLRPWPELDPYLLNGWSVSLMALRGHGHDVLVRLSNNGQHRYLHLAADDTSNDVLMIPPEGHSATGCVTLPVVGAQGELFTIWRDAASANIWELVGANDDWAPAELSLPVSQFAGLFLGMRDGTYWLTAYETGSCPGVWDPPPMEALLGGSTQIMRPQDNAYVELGYGAGLQVAPEGRCYARLGPLPDDPWVIEDLLGPGSIEVPDLGVPGWIPND
ncbi:hypothetical protein DB30_07248 [Enhygromyxa salina]|uniref:Uncharacterized protein n=1 Tax=Enhygromyxa salina TaxID=215803 RepID=A0A0C2CSA1_9BACT|nr:hypothetical protein [Enhygromyxa salina]KIG14061.1 hypothetical protein DB30_07248 [Enhygromyxa salina]